MAIALDGSILGLIDLGTLDSPGSDPLLHSPPPPFIGVLDLFPQNLGGKGYHMATKEEDGCMIK